ncbi:nucleopolyhedrovirus P10 family protein [Streptomyces sp. SAS_270]|uniref:nucleopolyhedrovirus P10 family protein n=1 Tax=Streptomyces sp. SAS_270 TaxID=3412748 RepID=UPI00403D52A6
MTADQWAHAVRRQLGLGRVLPLGGAGDGAWITEEAAGAVLRRAAAAVRGVRLGALRIALADPADTTSAVVPPPPSALPSGPLRVGAEFAASADPTAAGAEPLPATAARLRAALAAAATERLGLTVTDVDLGVTGLLDREEPVVTGADEKPATPPGRAPEGIADTDESRVAAAALSVPGVTRLTGVLGGPGRAVHIEDRPGREAALPRRHVRVELAVAPHLRTLDVTHEVRTAVTAALRDHPSVAVLVTAVE